jgi:multiple sugar transport system ATP-binding protein
VALARELVTESGVLFMDEPLSNLDARLRMDMRTELKRLHAATNRTIVYVTHDQMEALTLSSDLVVMNAGKVQQHGHPDEIYRRPANKFVSEFIGLTPINFIKCRVASGQLTFGDGKRVPGMDLASQADGTEVTFALRPEDITLSAVPSNEGLSGTVETVLPAGSSNFVSVVLNAGSDVLRVMVQDFHTTGTVAGHAPGEQVYLNFDRSRAMVFDAASGASL